MSSSRSPHHAAVGALETRTGTIARRGRPPRAQEPIRNYPRGACRAPAAGQTASGRRDSRSACRHNTQVRAATEAAEKGRPTRLGALMRYMLDTNILVYVLN